MLTRLRVRDFRVMGDLEFIPGSGLNIITGETGAGKSVLVGALDIVLGGETNRVDVRSPADVAIIQAEFTIEPESPTYDRLCGVLPDWRGPRLSIERRIYASGRSTSRILNRQVQKDLLARVGAWLVDFHGQHSHQLLLSSDTHLEILDGFGGLRTQKESVRDCYKKWIELKKSAAEYAAWLEEAQRDQEHRAFQLAELKQAGLKSGERNELEKDLRILSTGEQWMRSCEHTRDMLVAGEGSISERLMFITRELQSVARHFPELADSLKSLESARVEVEESAEVVRRISEQMEIDPERQNEIEERLSVLIGLEKRYGRDEQGLIDLVKELQQQVEALTDARARLKTLEDERDHARDELEETANALSRARLLAAERLAPQVEAEFGYLGLERSRLLIRLEPLPVQNGFAGDARGKERACFLFSSALEEEAQDLTKVASGGELSRIMLALKSVLRASDPVDAMVFDEIDTGVGGSLAPVIGDRLNRLGNDRQIICITHLAAVASAARNHFVVTKNIDDRIAIRITKLNDEERVMEIARMLGGLPTSQEAIRHSQVLLGQYTQGGNV